MRFMPMILLTFCFLISIDLLGQSYQRKSPVSLQPYHRNSYQSPPYKKPPPNETNNPFSRQNWKNNSATQSQWKNTTQDDAVQ